MIQQIYDMMKEKVSKMEARTSYTHPEVTVSDSDKLVDNPIKNDWPIVCKCYMYSNEIRITSPTGDLHDSEVDMMTTILSHEIMHALIFEIEDANASRRYDTFLHDTLDISDLRSYAHGRPDWIDEFDTS